MNSENENVEYELSSPEGGNGGIQILKVLLETGLSLLDVITDLAFGISLLY